MPRALIVDDQERVARALAILLDLHGISAETANGSEAALAALDKHDTFDVVLQDMNFSPGATEGRQGEALFRIIRARRPDLPVLLMTAWGSLESAVRLMKEGAADYIEKPWDDQDLVERVRELLDSSEASSTGRVAAPSSGAEEGLTVPTSPRPASDLADRFNLCGMLYSSSVMHEVLRLATRVASSDVSILIRGENGTGKEKLAEVVQANSKRRSGPFVKVNVGALPDSLIEAELFGAEAGAFTGATRPRVGRFEAADGGTLLLDEIGNLSPSGQQALLRVLETGELQRLGSSRSTRVDVRVLAATHADLRAAVRRGDFREDLYFRLAVLELELPPLRERGREVLLLADRFLQETHGARTETPRLGKLVQAALMRHSWPGNVRELRNAIQRAAVVAEGPEILPTDLGLPLSPPSSLLERDEGPRGQSSGDRLSQDTERARIEQALIEAGGVVSRAASSLGLSRQALYRRMDKLGIVLERRPRA